MSPAEAKQASLSFRKLLKEGVDPIWHAKTKTASRVRGRMEAVLDRAKARRLREGDSSALWRGHLDQLLLKRSRVQTVVRHPAMPSDELAACIRDLGAEASGARWKKIDDGKALWVILGSRMKAGRTSTRRGRAMLYCHPSRSSVAVQWSSAARPG